MGVVPLCISFVGFFICWLDISSTGLSYILECVLTKPLVPDEVYVHPLVYMPASALGV